MLEKIEKFFEKEYASTVRYFKYTHTKGNERIVVDNAISHCAGVAQFGQELGLTYEEIEPIYNYYKKKFKDLLDK